MKENEDLTKKSVNQLMIEMAQLDKQIDLLCLKHEKIRLELIRRYKVLENNEDFKQKKQI